MGKEVVILKYYLSLPFNLIKILSRGYNNDFYYSLH